MSTKGGCKHDQRYVTRSWLLCTWWKVFFQHVFQYRCIYKFDRIVSLSNSCTPISSVLAHFTKPTPLPCCYDNESEYIFVFNTAFYFTWFIILSPFDVTHHTIKYLGDGGSNVLPSITYLFVFLMWHSIGVTPFLPLKTCPDVMYRLTIMALQWHLWSFISLS